MQLVDQLVAGTEIYAAFDTLENLEKGGRIGKARSMLGSMLSIKPLIHIADGAVEEAGKQRTRRKSLEWLRDKLYDEGDIKHLTIAHGEAPDIDEFLDLIADRYPRDQIRHRDSRRGHRHARRAAHHRCLLREVARPHSTTTVGSLCPTRSLQAPQRPFGLTPTGATSSPDATSSSG